MNRGLVKLNRLESVTSAVILSIFILINCPTGWIFFIRGLTIYIIYAGCETNPVIFFRIVNTGSLILVITRRPSCGMLGPPD